MWQGRRRIWRGQHKIQFRLLPPGVPSGLVCLSLGHQFPLLESAPLLEFLKQSSPDVISPNIFDPKVVQVLYGTRDSHVESHLRCSGVIPLTSPIEGSKRLAAVRVQESGGYFQCFIRRWGLNSYNIVSLGSQSRHNLFQSTRTSRGRIDHTYAA